MESLIDKQMVLDALDRFSLGETDAVKLSFRLGDYLKRMPTLDAIPTRHGRWISVKDWDTDERYICTACFWEFNFIDGNPAENDFLYCPHCGARMEEEMAHNE